MTMTVTVGKTINLGAINAVFGTIAFDASYPTNGLAFPLTAVGAKSLLWLEVADAPGRPTRWNGSATAPTVIAVQDATPAAAAALPEVPNATNLSAVTAVPFYALVTY